MILRYALLWLVSFVAVSAVDALRHLGVSVYGLVSHWLIRDWSAGMTILEVVWGPLLGAFAGVFIARAGRLLKVY